MEFQSESSLASAARETIVVVNDAKRNKGSLEALDWAIKHVVRPKDTVVFLGVLSELRKKSSPSCFPFIGIPGISVKLEFSTQDEMSPGLFEEEIEKKREEYHSNLRPFYRQCMKSEVNLEVKLAAGFSPRKIIVEEAHKSNSRWIVLDSCLKKEKLFIHGNVACNVAVMKRKGIATLMPSRGPDCGKWLMESRGIEDFTYTVNESEQLQDDKGVDAGGDEELCPPASTPQCPCCHVWRTGLPRAFSFTELEEITNGFSNDNMIIEKDGCRIYDGILVQTPVLINCYPRGDERFLPLLKLVSQLRHQNIVNLVGYCCTTYSIFVLYDHPCSGLLEMNLKDDECGKNLSWTARWNIALEIGAALRYLQEECDADGPVVNISVCSTEIALFHGSSAKICLLNTDMWYKDSIPSDEDSSTPFPDIKEHLLADIRAYGMFLIEIITGKSRRYSEEQAVSLFQDGSLSEVIDNGLADTNDDGLIHNMAQAALLCLKSDLDHILTMSEILAVVRGDQVARPEI